MINAVIIDDERPAIRVLEYHLKKYPEISVAATFTNPLEAIENMHQHQPQVVFLDINMPQLQGIDAASKILDKSPDTEIVFVTAYEQYAIDAFEVHALDYILKPIDPARLKKTIERMMQRQWPEKPPVSQKLMIQTLGKFRIAWENQTPLKWRTEKTKELFLLLLHNKNRNMTKEDMLETLWPEQDPEKVVNQLYNGIYYIRKALKEYGIDRSMITIDSSYMLKLGGVVTDMDQFVGPAKNYRNLSVDQLLDLETSYSGDYLEGEDYQWADLERDSLLNMYYKVLIRLSEILMEKQEYPKAEALLLKGYNNNPYEDVCTELLIRLYALTGEKNKAAIHYQAYQRLLRQDLNIEPSRKIQTLYQAIR